MGAGVPTPSIRERRDVPTRPPIHRPQGWEPRKAWDTSTAPFSERYGSDWSTIRDHVLRDEPMCRPCLHAGRSRASTICDHIIAKAHGGTDARSNLQGICERCHKRKTANDRHPEHKLRAW